MSVITLSTMIVETDCGKQVVVSKLDRETGDEYQIFFAPLSDAYRFFYESLQVCLTADSTLEDFKFPGE